MLQTTQNYIPIVTSQAGLCLTAANWNEVGVTAASYYLDSLLLKPGYELLKNKIDDLGSYLAWKGTIVLNASTMTANKEGIFSLVSPYDGSKMRLSALELIEIIQHLKPAAVLLPARLIHHVPHIWDNWSEAIMPFIAAEEMPVEPPKPYGVYFKASHGSLDDAFLSQLNAWAHVPRYVIGQINLGLMNELKHQGIQFIESDEPAKAAMEGIVFSATGEINISHDGAKTQFKTIDEGCTCPTCVQQFTKAYAHHLLLHTPLLAQRLLMQHNVFYAQKNDW